MFSIKLKFDVCIVDHCSSYYNNFDVSRSQKKLQSLFKRISFVYEKFPEDEMRKFRRRIRIGALIVWLFLTSYFMVSMNSVFKMGMEKFLDTQKFWFKIPGMSTKMHFVFISVFMLFQQLTMWGTLSFVILVYVTLCDTIRLSFRSVDKKYRVTEN